MSKLMWRKSNICPIDGAKCIEIAVEGDYALIRESDDPEVVIRATLEDTASFLGGIQEGRPFGDIGGGFFVTQDDGMVGIRANDTEVRTSLEKYKVFTAGVNAGDFTLIGALATATV